MVQHYINTNGNKLSVIIFKVGWEEFAIDIADVKEIIQSGQIRRLPNSLDFIEGIYNYRGEIIHIVNLWKKLKMNNSTIYKSRIIKSNGENNGKKNKFMIILNFSNSYVGILVDQIINIVQVENDQLMELGPIFQTSVSMKYIKGIIRFKGTPKIVLDLGKILEDIDQFTIQNEVISN